MRGNIGSLYEYELVNMEIEICLNRQWWLKGFSVKSWCPSVMTHSILLLTRNRLFTVISSGAITEKFNQRKKKKKRTCRGKKRMDTYVILQGGLPGEANWDLSWSGYVKILANMWDRKSALDLSLLRGLLLCALYAS